MTYRIISENGVPLDARAEADSRGVTLHSRGGSATKGNVINAEYGPALRLLLHRIALAHLPFERAWVDSMDVQRIPIDQRLILSGPELDAGAGSAFTLMSRRMKGVGQAKGRKGGNSTKRIRIQFAKDISLAILTSALGLTHDFNQGPSGRLPNSAFEPVTAENIWNAIEKLRGGYLEHTYGPSTDYDLLTDAGERFPPKAVFGIAASEALGIEVLPEHFSSGLGTPCFQKLHQAGYDIVPRDEKYKPNDTILLEDRLWAEGNARLVTHLRRERASGLAQAKKDSFIRIHGQLSCEHCGIDPVSEYGPHGDACIEVHHRATQVENMTASHRTRLEDLMCLCANCHRVEHRRLKMSREERSQKEE